MKSKGIRMVRLLVRNYKLALQNVIYILNLKLNILLTERLKCNNYVKYSNQILYYLFDRATRRTIVKANRSLGLPVISFSLLGEETNLLGELDHFKAFNLYYVNTINQQISLDLAHCRLSHISKRLIKKLVKGMSIRINLKGIDTYKVRDANKHCDKCIIS